MPVAAQPPEKARKTVRFCLLFAKACSHHLCRIQPGLFGLAFRIAVTADEPLL